MSRIQDIFNEHGDAYLRKHGARVPGVHRQVIRAIQQCRTGRRGHHVFECPQCEEKHVAKSSCGNRHCPVCQNEKAAQWVYAQQLKLLPCTYFLATFTVPAALREVARRNQKVVYSAMAECSASTLRTLEADSRFVGCHVAGFTGVMHTWGRQLQYHPHVHYIIPGGGLDKDRCRWVCATGEFLVHVRALSRMFRGKMKDALDRAGLLESVPGEVWEQDWVVHCKPAGDGRHMVKYLGAYVFRVAISNARIEGYDGKTVTFKYQKVGSGKWRRMRLDVYEFMRRYLQHVLPKGFMKIRHYGFLSGNFAVAIQRIRELICVLYEALRDRPVAMPLEKPRPLKCPKCRTVMRWTCFMPALSP